MMNLTPLAYRTVQRTANSATLLSETPVAEHASKINCSLSGIKIRLVDPILDDQPRGLIVNLHRLTIITDERDRNYIAAKNCTIDKALLLQKEEDNTVRLAESFNLAMDSGEISHVKETQEDQLIHLIVEYQDIKMLSNIVTAFSETSPMPMRVKQEMIPVKPEIDAERLRLSKPTTLRITLINEFEFSPLLDLQFANTIAELSHWSSKTVTCCVILN
jgi:hypothetical protein